MYQNQACVIVCLTCSSVSRQRLLVFKYQQQLTFYKIMRTCNKNNRVMQCIPVMCIKYWPIFGLYLRLLIRLKQFVKHFLLFKGFCSISGNTAAHCTVYITYSLQSNCVACLKTIRGSVARSDSGHCSFSQSWAHLVVQDLLPQTDHVMCYVNVS